MGAVADEVFEELEVLPLFFDEVSDFALSFVFVKTAFITVFAVILNSLAVFFRYFGFLRPEILAFHFLNVYLKPSPV